MDLRDRVGSNIQRLRREKKLSQEELADRAGIHQTYLSGVEGGKRNPSVLVLDRISKALGVDAMDLFRRVPEIFPEIFRLIKPEGHRFKSYPRNHFCYNSLTVPI